MSIARSNTIVSAAGKVAKRRAAIAKRLESLEIRRMMSGNPLLSIRSVDGTGNNLANSGWGSVGVDLLRKAAAAYADGISAPVTSLDPAGSPSRPSARDISNAVSTNTLTEDEGRNNRNMAAFVYAWGQFLDHDMDLTNAASPAESFNINVSTGDPQFDPLSTGTQVIPLNRSVYDTTTGTSVANPRQQINTITAFIDGSVVYGSDSTRAAALRTFSGGLLKTSDGNLMPLNTVGLPNANDAHIFADNQLFLAGDVRANENVELTAVQTLFVREHNRIARELAANNPALTDEQIYQQARKIVGAEIQAITYNEFIPALLGQSALPQYTGYKPNVNAGIANEFSTAAFRVGHTLLQDDVEFLDNNGNEVHDEVPLAGAFFNPALVKETGIDPVLKYLASANAQEVDTKIIDGVRNFLFGPPGAGGLDLASLNIQRGRDHGLADYNTVRAAYGLPKVTSFAQITSDTALAAKLQSLYGSVDNIDLWVGGLAENHLAGSSVGATFQRIMVDQFTRLRDGDRFWYQRDLSPQDLQRVQNTHLADVIARNSTITNLQPNVFIFNVEVSGRVWQDLNQDRRPQQGEMGLARRTVTLVDDSGVTVQTAKTGPDGLYHFDKVALGNYHVVADLPQGWQATTLPPVELQITRGMKIDRVDFGQTRIGAPTQPPTQPPTQLPTKLPPQMPPPPPPAQQPPKNQQMPGSPVMPPPPPPPPGGTFGSGPVAGKNRPMDGLAS